MRYYTHVLRYSLIRTSSFLVQYITLQYTGSIHLAWISIPSHTRSISYLTPILLYGYATLGQCLQSEVQDFGFKPPESMPIFVYSFKKRAWICRDEHVVDGWVGRRITKTTMSVNLTVNWTYIIPTLQTNFLYYPC
ncbi:uncharacterized protein BDR25DRAFT_348800 [Lindgomyces ingoldianus]|uniref:Uncharacterized protein n=1 Tax=Lindgomyces ingoldianus TaxID=673940 RepID=A0ACB6RCP9_9PLEO|nr:uncharacterized protein BDR25DRAFT_348800 [Lindgomyces ingoldianus]KAF2476867.1 hypothetical protein BDR25DRAFT_348800 [Lindgomyces ingoldianus]